MSTIINEEIVIDVLKQCYDPEIPIDLWSLGLIYNINITEASNNKSDVHITMTLTTPGCTMGQHMADDIKSKLEYMEDIDSATVEVTFEPPWEPEMMSDEARTKLGFPSNNKPASEDNWE